MTCVGVDGVNTMTNHIAEIEQVLGVEAARTKIMQEIRYIFDQYGMGIDHRHIMLLADLMTYKVRSSGTLQNILSNRLNGVFTTYFYYLFDQYGVGIAHCHNMLLADLMTYKVRSLFCFLLKRNKYAPHCDSLSAPCALHARICTCMHTQ